MTRLREDRDGSDRAPPGGRREIARFGEEGGLAVRHRRAIRTTNLLERLFVEERRRLKIIPNALVKSRCSSSCSAPWIRAAERWQTIRITDFERRQMAALRRGLDHEYEARNAVVKPTLCENHPSKLSNNASSRFEHRCVFDYSHHPRGIAPRVGRAWQL